MALLLKPGDQLGDWTIDAAIGEGGMGAVFRAHHALLPDVPAAIKVMKPTALDDGAQRFLREVKAVLRLHHPNIVRVSGFGRDPARGLLWMAMDLVEGGDLERRIAQGPIGLPALVPMFFGLADALVHAHALGVFHRDLKPSNVLLDASGVARLVDFGIAVQQSESRLTSTGLVLGTPAYLPPELFEGEIADPRLSDLYALGQLLYEASTGRPAFPDEPGLGDSQRTVRLMGLKARAPALDPGPAFPEAFRDLVRDLTEPRPELRLADATLARDRLAALAAAVAPRPTTARTRVPPRRRAFPWLLAAGASLTTLLGGAVIAVGAAGAGLWYAGFVPDLALLDDEEPDAAHAPVPEPVPDLAPARDLTGDEAFVAALAAVPTEPCAHENGVRDARAKIEIRVGGGRVVEATALDGFGDAAFARCLVVELYSAAIETDDGRGVYTFEHVAPAAAPRAARPSRLATGGAVASAPAAARPPSIPQACGLASPVFGPLAVGAEVEVGRHRSVDGDDNWASSMDAYVGRRARVRSLSTSTDNQGCAIVRLDVDDGAWGWRARDLSFVRAASGSAIPQACGESEGRYGPIVIGTKVTPSRHRLVDGAANWAIEMEAFVARPAVVTALEGVDAQGCSLVRLDVDEGAWWWRVRDLKLR